MSKEEREEAFRDDTVDEVDTTDLENWALRERARSEESDEDFQLDAKFTQSKESLKEK